VTDGLIIALLWLSIAANGVTFLLAEMKRRAAAKTARATDEAVKMLAADIVQGELVKGMIADLDFAHRTAGDRIGARVWRRFDHGGRRLQLELKRVAKSEVAA
jgi:uncharacterized membrane protein YsdA (DUF1294 family)